VGANVQPGQSVLVIAAPSSARLVRALAAECYAHGALFVDPWYFDPEVKRIRAEHADASTLGKTEIEEAIRKGVRNHGKGTWNGQLDLVVGGVPCQGFSAIGKRRPNDPRNQLAFSFLRIVRALQPRYFLMENVQGMTSFVDPSGDGHGTLLAKVIEEFEGADYNVLPQRVLNASWFGVPQDRRRLILVGYRKGEAAPLYADPICRPVPKRYGDKPRAGEWGHAKAPRNLPIGPVDPEVGPPTQLAVFSMRASE